MNSQEILFVSHDAGRTRAPLVLLNFQRWLKEHTNGDFVTILRRTGPLAAEFAKLDETFLIEAPRRERLTLGGRIAKRLGWRAIDWLRCAGRSHQLIYSNTDVLQVLARPGEPARERPVVA